MLIYWGADADWTASVEDIAKVERCVVMVMAAACNQFVTACRKNVRNATLGNESNISCTKCKEWLADNQ